nr:unnamed protein product [Callosobruchus analis]
MHENICLQCKKVPQGPLNRLVQDSCGHKKCRTCLLNDDVRCKLCEEDSFRSNFKTNYKCDKNGDSVNEVVLNNHTGVIQLNGNVPNNVNGNEINGRHEMQDSFCEQTGDKYVEEVQTPVARPITNASVEETNKSTSGSEKSNDSNIPNHIKVLTEPLSYHCTICDKKFITKTHVRYHAYCTGAPKPYKCDVCQKEFILRAQLDVHSYKHKNNKPHVCNVCKKSFSDRSKLSRHAAVHSTIKSFICSTCGNAYRSKESLRLHSVTHKSEKPYGCKLCTAKFNNLSNLNKHVVTHSKEKSHMCDQCGKRFKQKLSLSVHHRSHLRTRQHQCGVCLRAFVNSKDLKRHSLIHADTKGYACGICSTSFRRKDNLRRHMKNTHPGKTAEIVMVPVQASSSSRELLAPPLPAAKAPVPVPPPLPPPDTPNAIKVITSASSVVHSDCRPPLAAAGGVDADPTNQDAARGGAIRPVWQRTEGDAATVSVSDFNYVPAAQRENIHVMAESIDICQKILSTSSSNLPVAARGIIRKAEPTSEEICQKILGQNPTTSPLHYETSFQNRKHAMIKNIKFKVPIQYTKTFQEERGTAEVTEQQTDVHRSVIVNNNNVAQSTSLHWRRRTSQNLQYRPKLD